MELGAEKGELFLKKKKASRRGQSLLDRINL